MYYSTIHHLITLMFLFHFFSHVRNFLHTKSMQFRPKRSLENGNFLLSIPVFSLLFFLPHGINLVTNCPRRLDPLIGNKVFRNLQFLRFSMPLNKSLRLHSTIFRIHFLSHFVYSLHIYYHLHIIQ